MPLKLDLYNMFIGSNIIKTSLSLSYDPANIKSFKGLSTTNLMAVGYSYNNLDYTKFSNLTWRGGHVVGTITQNCAIPNITVTGGTQVTMPPSPSGDTNPCFYPFNNQGALNVYFVGTAWIYNNGLYSFTIQFSNGCARTVSATIAPGEIKKIVFKGYTAELYVHRVAFIKSNKLDDVSFIGYQLQVEVGTAETPFVDGMRGNTVETGGGLYDLSRNNANGELMNGISYNPTKKGVLVCDGVNDYIKGAGINFTTELTYGGWVYRNDETNDRSVMGKLDNTTTGGTTMIYFFGRADMRTACGFYVWTTNGTSIVRTAIYPTGFQYNKWQHIYLVFKSSMLYAYLNGVMVGNSATSYSTLYNTVNPFQFGYTAFGYFLGMFGELKVYNKGFSTAEVYQNYSATKTRYEI